ncbi:hypothetical protein BJX99DRAFT_239785, partial [Aspergillus californicus]
MYRRLSARGMLGVSLCLWTECHWASIILCNASDELIGSSAGLIKQQCIAPDSRFYGSRPMCLSYCDPRSS